MSFLLAEPNGSDLGVRKDTNDSAVLLELLKLCLDALLAVCILLGIPRERLLLALVPVESGLIDRCMSQSDGGHSSSDKSMSYATPRYRQL